MRKSVGYYAQNLVVCLARTRRAGDLVSVRSYPASEECGFPNDLPKYLQSPRHSVQH